MFGIKRKKDTPVDTGMVEFYLMYPDYTIEDHEIAAAHLMEQREIAKSRMQYGTESIYWNEALRHQNMALILARVVCEP